MENGFTIWSDDDELTSGLSLPEAKQTIDEWLDAP
jgi:hypothetical protein